MNTSEFDYYLPEELIAQHPLEKRDDSRLMILNKETGKIKHERFYNLPNFIEKDDVLVFNNTRVLPARLYGKKSDTGANIEILLLKRRSLKNWQILIKPAKRVKEGSKVQFADDKLVMTILEKEDEGIAEAEFKYEGVFEKILEDYGNIPLPPYIHEKLTDKERYQTIYSKENGSSAAPTAGLHFTKEVLNDLKEKGIQMEYLTLHVGLGTFRPVKAEKIEEHKMHSEHYQIDEETAKRLNEAKKAGKRIIAVGTTSVRTLESSVVNDELKNLNGDTDIFIYPGYEFKFVDKMITNFHLPCSTLIMMISAFAGKENVMNAYETAVRGKYRFFSFGDSMFIK